MDLKYNGKLLSIVSNLVDRLSDKDIRGTNIIPWSCPIPSFGDLTTAKVATLGLNPSNREFQDSKGNELCGLDRRFPTLKSLNITNWQQLENQHLSLIIKSCSRYFQLNPYSSWFNRLEDIILGANSSYYGSPIKACHMDLIPFATEKKWTALNKKEKSLLIDKSGDSLGRLLQHSPVRLLILNGSAVVNGFKAISNVVLEKRESCKWDLKRRSGPDIKGYAYTGIVSEISGRKLDRNIFVAGFNHNIQSSFGISKSISFSINKWLSRISEKSIS